MPDLLRTSTEPGCPFFVKVLIVDRETLIVDENPLIVDKETPIVDKNPPIEPSTNNCTIKKTFRHKA